MRSVFCCINVNSKSVSLPPIDSRVNWKLEEVSRNADGSFTLAYDTPEGKQSLETKCLALTAPAYVVADLLESSCVSQFYFFRQFRKPDLTLSSEQRFPISKAISIQRQHRKCSDRLNSCNYSRPTYSLKYQTHYDSNDWGNISFHLSNFCIHA